MFLFLLCVAHISVGGFVRGKPPKTPKEFLVADAIFHKVDLDGDGNVDPDELLKYLLKVGELPSVAHELLRKLDVNGDGLISLEEWRAGWVKGMIPQEATTDEEAAKDAKVNGVPPATTRVGEQQQQQQKGALVPSRSRVSP